MFDKLFVSRADFNSVNGFKEKRATLYTLRWILNLLEKRPVANLY